MKTIQPVTIWSNGETKQANVLNAYAVNVKLNVSATFYYSLQKESEILTQGNIVMDGDNYTAWQDDSVAWDFIASKLNLTIIGEYPLPSVEEPSVEEEPTQNQ